MGDVIHKAIVVTSWSSETIHAAWEVANALNMYVTKIGPMCINGYQSFLVCSCGSMLDWTADRDYAQLLDRYIAYLKSTPFVEWAAIVYGNNLSGMDIPPLIRCN